MTSGNALRVFVRNTDSGKIYAYSPDLPGLHVYVRDEGQLVQEIEHAICELAEALNGTSATAVPESGGPADAPWIWRVSYAPARACA